TRVAVRSASASARDAAPPASCHSAARRPCVDLAERARGLPLRRIDAAPRQRGSGVDFAEFFTQTAREIVSIAWSRDLLFLFDHRGPFIDIDADASSMHRAVRRLANGTLGLLDDGFIFLSAQVDWNGEGVVDIAISVAGTGHR